jgi:hypothetical protein
MKFCVADTSAAIPIGGTSSDVQDVSPQRLFNRQLLKERPIPPNLYVVEREEATLAFLRHENSVGNLLA